MRILRSWNSGTPFYKTPNSPHLAKIAQIGLRGLVHSKVLYHKLVTAEWSLGRYLFSKRLINNVFCPGSPSVTAESRNLVNRTEASHPQLRQLCQQHHCLYEELKATVKNATAAVSNCKGQGCSKNYPHGKCLWRGCISAQAAYRAPSFNFSSATTFRTVSEIFTEGGPHHFTCPKPRTMVLRLSSLSPWSNP